MPENIKHKIGHFYNEVGWQQEASGLYQNAQYEDLRPVSADYIARGHARVGEHLAKEGKYLLDAGSGPVQYDAYLQYSKGYVKRVCFDLSHVALAEARKRLGEKGFYVVGDISHLPFKKEVFDGIVSLHTIHHLPMEEKQACYLSLYERLKPGRSMVTVDGWSEYKLKKLCRRIENVKIRFNKEFELKNSNNSEKSNFNSLNTGKKSGPAGTFVKQSNAEWFKHTFNGVLSYKILSWRSVSVRFLRTVIQSDNRGYRTLKILSWLEDRFPRFFGENGQYPLIVINKPAVKSDKA
ncbi:MAG: class I SAM-dependent methyltransferase [Anaerolineaceae bacterium]|nr:class I SAM-dependent methyltransferase [Anaerolineaceae bacterium]